MQTGIGLFLILYKSDFGWLVFNTILKYYSIQIRRENNILWFQVGKIPCPKCGVETYLDSNGLGGLLDDFGAARFGKSDASDQVYSNVRF